MKSGFRTPVGSYVWRVITFGLTNAPSTFMTVMDDILDPCKTTQLSIWMMCASSLRMSQTISSTYNKFWQRCAQKSFTLNSVNAVVANQNCLSWATLSAKLVLKQTRRRSLQFRIGQSPKPFQSKDPSWALQITSECFYKVILTLQHHSPDCSERTHLMCGTQTPSRHLLRSSTG